MARRDDSVVLGQLVIFDPARLHGREEHRSSRKNSPAISLDEVRGRRADSDDEVRRLFRIEGIKIIDEWAVRFVVVQPSIQKRVILEIDWPLRVSGYLRANDLRVIGPWLEAKTKRVQHQDPFGLYIRPTARRREQNNGCGEQNTDRQCRIGACS